MALPYIERLENQTYAQGESGAYTFSVVRLYDVSSLDLDHENALEEVMSELPTIKTAHPSISPVVWLVNANVESIGESGEVILATLTYQTPELSGGVANNDNEIWSWQMTAQQGHILSAPESLGGVLEWNYYDTRSGKAKRDGNGSAPLKFAPDLMIGRKGEGDYEGVNIYQGTGSLKVSKYYGNKADIDTAFRQNLYAKQATVNDASWIDWTVGEVLYLGAQIRFGVTDATVDHQFLFGDSKTGVQFKIAPETGFAEPLTTITVGGSIQPWYYVWQEPVNRKVSTASTPKGNQTCARNLKIAEIYATSDFDDIDLVGP